MKEFENSTSLLPSENHGIIQPPSQYSAVPIDLSDSEDYEHDFEDSEASAEGSKDKTLSWAKVCLRVILFLIFLLVVTVVGSVIGNLVSPRAATDAVETKKDSSLLSSADLNVSSQFDSTLDLSPKQSSVDHSKQLFQFEDVYSGKFRPQSPSLDWVTTETEDGKYSYEDFDTGEIRLSHADTKWAVKEEYKVLIDRKTIDKYDPRSPFSSYILSPDLKYIAVLNYYEKVWRHSFTAQYRIFDLGDISKPPITVSPRQGQHFDNETHYISLFQWSAKGHDVSFVLHNDVYVLSNDFKTTVRVTNDGGPEVINGIPDWVYEEEVYAGNSATWWSPDGNYIAYLSFDDRPVPEVQVPLFSNGAILSHANLIESSNIPLTSPIPKDPKDISKFLSSYADYPQYVKFKYPKSGHTNPLVTLNLFQVKDDQGKYITTKDVTEKRHASRSVRMDFDPILSSKNPRLLELAKSMNSDSKNQIISDVVWDLQSGSLIVRFTNKAQDIIATSIVDVKSFKHKHLKGKVVRLEPGGLDFSPRASKKGDGGWYQTDSHPIVPIPKLNTNETELSKVTGYIDRVVLNGNYHLALFSSLDASTPAYFLTKGPYDIDASIGIDVQRGRVYYSSRELDSTASHIYSVNLKGIHKRHISDELGVVTSSLNDYYTKEVSTGDADSKLDRIGHFQGTISPMGGYMLLSYLGPHVPYHVLVKEGDSDKAVVLEKNSALRKRLNEYDIPLPHFTRVMVNGSELNSMEIRPPSSVISKDKKLRVLFRCYGGPESQLVSRSFRFDFHTWLVSNLTDIAVVVVDGRGTGYKGRKFAVGITGNLGEQEAQDQLGAIKEYSKYDWVDPKHLGLWGWSFGGYLTAKTVEADNDGVLAAAISVAPVSDWRFYDSIYTERYMKTPQLNPSGYVKSAVNRVDNFNRTNYLLMHGAADDNVHLQNTFRLIDLFNNARITRPVFFTFPDNDHSVAAPYSNRALYNRLYQHVRDRL